MFFDRIRLKDPSEATGVELAFLGALPTDPYLLKGGDGLDGPSIDLFYSKRSQGGASYGGNRPQERQITLLIGLNPDYEGGETAGDLRSALYELQTLEPDKELEVEIRATGAIVATATGRISKITAPAFAQEIEAQVVIDCNSAFFVGRPEVDATYLSNSQRRLVNPGNAPTPFYAEIKMPSNSPTLSIYVPGVWSVLNFTYAFLANDVIRISTEPGFSYASLARGADPLVNLVAAIAQPSTWFQLRAGINDISISPAPGALANAEISCFPRYWGV